MKYILVLFFVFGWQWAGAQADYSLLDEKIRNFRKSDYATPEALAMALCRDLITDHEKARAIFTWIAEHIRYHMVSDPPAKSKKAYYDLRVKQVFRRGKGVCMDYALLYQRMAQAVGLNCAFIGGHSKTFAHEWESHAWNAVFIEGKWELLDVTWGAGSRDEQGKFVQEFKPGFFLTEPRIFLLNHFPDSSQWQLVQEPITSEEFKKLSHFSYGNLEHGIQDATLQKAPKAGYLTLSLKILRPPSILHIDMGGRNLPLERNDEDGWTKLTFKPTAGRSFQLWGGEKQKNKTHLELMGAFRVP
ncbi:MAG: hypothetical protein IT261_13470 [Saprospiraceae bacterium]|nr:hypothetical protein [Saprospiraceae bacterium]